VAQASSLRIRLGPRRGERLLYLVSMIDSERTFQPYGAAHLTAILLTIAVPFVLAAIVRQTKSQLVERAVVFSLSVLLILNYVSYMMRVRQFGAVSWQQILPLQLCDWGMVVVIVAMLSGNQRWFEVAYFWGIGGTLQAVLTPNLRYGFPDFRFISFFVAHSGIIVGVIFLMLVRRYRPYPMSILRTFAWTELYFVITFMADALTGFNYGFLLHKPEAFSILSFLSDWRPLYLLQMHLLAWVFFVVLYLPFLTADLVRQKSDR
jgi:hypothetical integral membrane protein (TIGR02206 family)